MSVTSSPPQVGDEFGDYRIEELLGRGAMGLVYRAWQRRMNRPVALKVLPVDVADDPTYRARFAREAAALAQLDSPHVIQIYDHGTEDGHLYLAMQLVQGPDLGRVLERGVLSPRRALRITDQIATALGDGHAVGVVHRDVKPGNVLLRARRPDEDPDAEDGDFAYLCDFGIARSAGDVHAGSLTAGVIGTLGYLAPERLQGDPATPASDVYSLGCLLWALLVGAPPYSGVQPAVIMSHLRAPVRQLDSHDPRTAMVNALLAGTMAKDPADRLDIPGTRRQIRAIMAAVGSGAGATPLLRPQQLPAAPVVAAPDATTTPGIAAGYSGSAPDPPAAIPSPGSGSGGSGGSGSAPRSAAGSVAGSTGGPGSSPGPISGAAPSTLSRIGRSRGLIVAAVLGTVLVIGAALVLLTLRDPARSGPDRLRQATPVGVSCTAAAVPDAAANAGAVAQSVCTPGPDVGELRLVALRGPAEDYLREIVRQDPAALPSGSCPDGVPASTSWQAGGHRGTLLCFVLGPNTRYAWTFDDLDVVAVLDGPAATPFPRDLGPVAAFFAGARYP